MRKIFLILVFLAKCNVGAQPVHPGAQVLVEKYLDSLAHKRVGVVCNQSSVLPNGTHLVDTLLSRGVNITALFAPEHGIRGSYAAGQKVGDEYDHGIRVYSLYGGTRKPAPNTLENVDVILFDLQDAGARFYTYTTTMAYVMMAAAENSKKFILLDRPNPINAKDVEGPVLDLTLISFVGYFPIPIRYGLTLGELARMCIGEGFINPSTVDLMVVPMEGWTRSMWYDQTGLPWIPPSPNMKSLSTATVYPGTCLFEPTNISEGRGSPKPFEYIGAPGLNTAKITGRLNNLKLPGVRFSPVVFTPLPDSASGLDPKFKGKPCQGVYVRVTDRNAFRPVITGLMMLKVFLGMYPHKLQIKQGLLDHLAGDATISDRLMKGTLERNVLEKFRSQSDLYSQIRSKYLLYK